MDLATWGSYSYSYPCPLRRQLLAREEHVAYSSLSVLLSDGRGRSSRDYQGGRAAFGLSVAELLLLLIE
jgi:hypothetical protein